MSSRQRLQRWERENLGQADLLHDSDGWYCTLGAGLKDVCGSGNTAKVAVDAAMANWSKALS